MPINTVLQTQIHPDHHTDQCFRAGHASRVLGPSAASQVEYWKKFREGAFVGDSPSDRDATLLRSQLEPWPTPILRQRLVDVFGGNFTELVELGRAEIMERLLLAYHQAGTERKVIRANGIPVRESLIELLLVELRAWALRHTKNRQERPSISAKSYMILRSPAEFSTKNSQKAKLAAAKIRQYSTLWELATMAITEADPEYATKFTALAVTMGFQGSPHIDKQNVGPFYGLAIGDFPDGQGGICVECSAFVVAQVNTKNRLGKVDGRFPHWVAPYDPETTRYSLIYYQTDGKQTPKTSAFFSPVVSEGEV